MNDQLRKLRLQAINECLDKERTTQGNLSEEVAQRFAELLILECSEIVLGFYNQFGDSAHGEIKEHFGVKG